MGHERESYAPATLILIPIKRVAPVPAPISIERESSLDNGTLQSTLREAFSDASYEEDSSETCWQSF